MASCSSIYLSTHLPVALSTYQALLFNLFWQLCQLIQQVVAPTKRCYILIVLTQVPAVDAQSCAAELHHALAKNDYQQASSLIRLAPHPGVFEMVNKQQQNALHLAGTYLCQRMLSRNQNQCRLIIGFLLLVYLCLCMQDIPATAFGSAPP